MKEKTAQLSILTTSYNVVEAANAEPGNPKRTGRTVNLLVLTEQHKLDTKQLS
jgi:hypothetical protein